MTDIGSPFGVDLATMLFGAGVSLLLSAGAMRYEHEVPQWTAPEMLGAAGGTFVVIGAVLGVLLALWGLR